MTTCRVWAVKGLAALGMLLIPLVAIADPGDLDAGFSGDGYVIDAVSGIGHRVVLDSSGRTVVVGFDPTGVGLSDILVARYTTNGERDTRFAGDGYTTLDIAGGSDEARGVAIDDQGRIVVAGAAFNGTNSDILVARYLSNGTLDDSFSGDGWVATDLSSADDYGRGVAIDAAGRIIVVGTGMGASDEDVAVVRYLEDGRLDGSFSANLVDMGANDGAMSVVLDGEGRIVVGGYSEARPGSEAVVLRLDADGSPDGSFSGDGKLILQASGDDRGEDVALDDQGRILVASIRSVGMDRVEMLARRLTATGALDPSFGNGGEVTVRDNRYDGGYALEIMAAGRGRVVIAGMLSNPSGADAAVVRLRGDGSLEPSFGVGGIATTDIEASDFAVGAVLADFDDVMVTGYVSLDSNRLLVAKFQGSSPRVDFVDDDDSVFENDIESLAVAGITNGCDPPDNTSFCPDDLVTRGQMSAFLVRALDYTGGVGSDAFTDDDDSVFESDIERLAAVGVAVGCNPPDNTLFCPHDPVSRGQMAAFLVRALGLTDSGSASFDDTEGSVFQEDIARLAHAGITRGCNPPANTLFCPDDLVTRGQVAAFLVRALALD